MEKAPYTEEQLLFSLANRDALVFSQVFKEDYSALCYFATKFVEERNQAEDLVQEVFERLWDNQTGFKNEKHLKDFLYKSTRNACLNFIKKSSKAKERQGVFFYTQQQTETASDLAIIQTEVFRKIYQEIKQLPQQSRRIVQMSYLECLKNEEIAKELGLSIQTVKNQKTRGISLLKKRISPEILALFIVLMRAS